MRESSDGLLARLIVHRTVLDGEGNPIDEAFASAPGSLLLLQAISPGIDGTLRIDVLGEPESHRQLPDHRLLRCGG